VAAAVGKMIASALGAEATEESAVAASTLAA
jgi:hypothetical protein